MREINSRNVLKIPNSSEQSETASLFWNVYPRVSLLCMPFCYNFSRFGRRKKKRMLQMSTTASMGKLTEINESFAHHHEKVIKNLLGRHIHPFFFSPLHRHILLRRVGSSTIIVITTTAINMCLLVWKQKRQRFLKKGSSWCNQTPEADVKKKS